MKKNALQPLFILLLILTGLTGCLDEENGSDDKDLPSTVQAPVWEVGKFWVYAFTTPDEEDIATRMVVAPDDGTNHFVGTASAEEARRHAVLNYNPLLGRVELNNFSVYEDGKPQSLFMFPLQKGNSWSFSFLGVEGWQATVVSIERADIPSMGEPIIVNIHAEAPGGEIMDYSFDMTAGWIHLIRAMDSQGETIVNMTLVSFGTGYTGQVHFMRGLNLFDRSYSSSPGSPEVDVYDTFVDSGHPDHGDFDTLVIYLNYRIGGNSGGSLSIKDHASNEVYIRSWSSQGEDNDLDDIRDEAGEYGVTVNLEGNCDLRVRVAGGIMYSWDV